MLRVIFICALTFLSCSSSSVHNKDDLQEDLKINKSTIKDSTSTNPSLKYSWDGSLFVGSMKKGVPDSVCAEFYDNGDIKKVMYIKNGKGHVMTFRPNGVLMSVDQLVTGEHFDQPVLVEEGYSYSFYDSGGISLILNKKAIRGTVDRLDYYPNGLLKQKSHYRNHLKHGLWKFMDSTTGCVVRKEYYKDDKKVR